MKIYTKTGDRGETGLYGGKRVSKSSLRIEAIGSVDELNSAIGVTIAEVQSSKLKVISYNAKLKVELEKIQNDLFEIGSALANPRLKIKDLRLMNRVKDFEKSIDEMTEELLELRNFILPGGGRIGSMLHFARTICRRAERRIVEVSKKESIQKEVLIYFNRLSDLFFTMARFANHKQKKKEIVWKKPL